MIVGVLGGGQLGRMLALAGLPLGLRFRFLDPSAESPARQVGELIVGDYADPVALEQFRAGLRVVTYEFESVPAAAVNTLAKHLPVYPPPQALEAAQDRIHEKTLFDRLAIPTPPFAAVDSEAELRDALARIGLPAMLKTRRLGYDGKGQAVLQTPPDVAPAWERLGAVPLIVEQRVPFEREVSLLSVRAIDGATAFYPLVENHHRDGILRLSLAPAADTAQLQTLAESYAARIMAELDYVGVLAVEFFLKDGRLLANEMAPRVHNSGHWTIEGAATSQFQNHLRAILGLPLGATTVSSRAAMFNLVGTVPPLEKILSVSGASPHLYDKAPVPDRKLGHVSLSGIDNAKLFDDRLRQLAIFIDPDISLARRASD